MQQIFVFVFHEKLGNNQSTNYYDNSDTTHQEMMVRTLIWPDSLAVGFLNSYVDKKRVPHLPRKPIRPNQISASKSFC